MEKNSKVCLQMASKKWEEISTGNYGAVAQQTAKVRADGIRRVRHAA
jgi:hypothetical protein